MSFMRRWTLASEASCSNAGAHSENEIRKPQLEIYSEELNPRRERKRDFIGSTSNINGTVSCETKRRKTTTEYSYSFSDLLINPIKAVYRFISGDDRHVFERQEDDFARANGMPTTPSSRNSEKNQFTFPAKPAVVDLTLDSEEDDSEVEIIGQVTKAAEPHIAKQELKITRHDVVELSGSGGAGNDDEVLYLDAQPSCSYLEKQDEEGEGNVVQVDKEVEKQEDADDVTIVAEVCHIPREALAANRRSIECARDQVTSMSLASPARSNSSVSIHIEGQIPGDQASLSSPAPEDSVSRQGTPHAFRIDSPSARSDPWKRRRSCISKSKMTRCSHLQSIEKNIARLRHTGGVSEGNESNVNLLARDCLLDMIEKMGGHAVEYPSRKEDVILDGSFEKRKSFQSARRLRHSYDGIRRVRLVLDKYGKKESKRGTVSIKNGDGLNRTFERQSSSEQSSNDGNDSTSFTASMDNDSRIEYQSSRSSTPMSIQSTSIDRITELLEKLNSFGQRPTPQQKYNRFVAERRELLDREIALQEEIRVRNLARLTTRQLVEEQTRRRLELVGIRAPAPKPKVKDEFPPLSDEAEELCARVWNRHLPQTEQLSEGFGLQLTRKDLSTLAGLDWLNDEVINFYLQLVCQRNSETKGLPKTYAFNTFFYTNITTKGYASVKRWTRKVDIFEHDLLLVPVHLSVHWCMAVIDLAEKRIDYYDSLLGRNNQCLEHLKDYLAEERRDKSKQDFDFRDWIFNLRTDIPRQMNGSDCGVFACKFAEFASRRAPIVFTQEHIPYYRRRMVYELMTKKLL